MHGIYKRIGENLAGIYHIFSQSPQRIQLAAYSEQLFRLKSIKTRFVMGLWGEP